MTSHRIFNARGWISYLFGVLYFYVCTISSVLHKRILCPSKRNYHGSISRERLSERVAIISKSIKCKNDRRWFPAWLCRGSNSVVRTSTVLFFFKSPVYKCTFLTKLLFITFVVIRPAYMLSIVSSLSHTFFFIFVLPIRTFTHTYTNTAHQYARILTHASHSLCTQRNTHYSRVTLNNCIII